MMNMPLGTGFIHDLLTLRYVFIYFILLNRKRTYYIKKYVKPNYLLIYYLPTVQKSNIIEEIFTSVLTIAV